MDFFFYIVIIVAIVFGFNAYESKKKFKLKERELRVEERRIELEKLKLEKGTHQNEKEDSSELEVKR